MTYAFVQVFPAYTREQYDTIVGCLGEGPFPGLVAHLAGPCDDGWRIIQVWQSAADYLRHARGPLAAALDTVRAGRAVLPPKFEEIEVCHVMVGPSS